MVIVSDELITALLESPVLSRKSNLFYIFLERSQYWLMFLGCAYAKIPPGWKIIPFPVYLVCPITKSANFPQRGILFDGHKNRHNSDVRSSDWV